MLISLGLSTIALAAIPFANSVTIVIVANAILWFAVSAAASVLTLLAVANVHEHDWDQRIGVLNKYQGYGWLLGLLAGAAWNAVGSTIDPATDAQRLFFFALAATTALGLTVTADRTTLATLTALGYRQRSLTILVTTQPITITTAGTLGITDGLLGIDAVNALDSQYAGTGMGGAVPHAPRRRRILVAVLIRLVATPYLTCLACRTSSHEQLTT